MKEPASAGFLWLDRAFGWRCSIAFGQPRLRVTQSGLSKSPHVASVYALGRADVRSPKPVHCIAGAPEISWSSGAIQADGWITIGGHWVASGPVWNACAVVVEASDVVDDVPHGQSMAGVVAAAGELTFFKSRKNRSITALALRLPLRLMLPGRSYSWPAAFDAGRWRTGCQDVLCTFALRASCRIPDDCIDSKRYPLFMARSVLQELIESLQSTQGVKPR